MEGVKKGGLILYQRGRGVDPPPLKRLTFLGKIYKTFVISFIDTLPKILG